MFARSPRFAALVATPLLALSLACDKKSSDNRVAEATSTASPTATATDAATTAPVAKDVSYTVTCTVKAAEIYLAEDAKRAGPKDPDPSKGEGEVVFTLLPDADHVIRGEGKGALGALTARGTLSAERMLVSFDPAQPAMSAWSGTLDLDRQAGGPLRASSGNAESPRGGVCVVKGNAR